MQRSTVQLLSAALFLGLLLWGVPNTLVYFGVPVHGAVLLSTEVSDSLQGLCSGLLCRGVYSLIPAVTGTLTRLPFLVLFSVLSAVFYGAFLVWRKVKRGTTHLQLRLTTLKILLVFVGILWLMFTSLSFSNYGGANIRRVVDPVPQVYKTAGPEAIQVLTENFNQLNDRGCLSLVGPFGGGVTEEYRLTDRCVQMSFFTRVLPPLLFSLVFLLELLIAGSILFTTFRLRAHRLLAETVVCLGLGICAWVAALWLFAVLGIFTSTIGWALMIFVPSVGWRHLRRWLRRFSGHARNATWDMDKPFWSGTVLLLWLLFGYLALNYLNVVRPFPIGWDDLGSYINRPRLLVSYGTFIFSMAAFQWEYITALGFLLFGYDSIFGAISALIINWTAGALTVFLVYAFTNVFLGRGRGLLAALLYYTLPLVGHFSFADMKIDNAVFAMGVMATFTLFLHLFPPKEVGTVEEDAEATADTASSRSGNYALLRWVAVAGVFAGFAFSMKATGIMIIAGLGAALAGAMLHWSGFIASVFFVAAAFVKKGILNVVDIQARLDGESILTQTSFFWLCTVFGLLCLLFAALQNPSRARTTLVTAVTFIAGFFIAVFPWIEHNSIQRGNLIPRKIELGAVNTLTPIIDPFNIIEEAHGAPVRHLPPELVVDKSHQLCTPTGAEEELGRYWGKRKGWGHYLTLPWRTTMNIDSAGYYVTTMPALLLFPLLLLLPFFWKRSERWLRWLFGATVFIILQWVFLANGIPWYGIGMFLGIVVGLEALFARAPDLPNRVLVGILLFLSVVSNLGMRMWQYEQQYNVFEYPLGKVSATALEERTIPHYDDIADVVVARAEAMPDRPYLYRIGTFIPYFIPKSLEIIGVTDHQLDLFNCIHQERDNALTLARLKALGFNSIVFDTNTATIERDPNGSLHKKVQIFADFINDPNVNMQVVVNDPANGIAFLLIP